MWKNKKICSALALAAAVAMLASGCSSGETNGDSDETSASVNVIGDAGSADGTSAPDGSPAEMVTVTDENGETVTGVNGDALSQPVATEVDPAHTLSENDILNAMATTTAPPQLNISQTNTERYGNSTLTAEEKKLYDDIVAGIEGLRGPKYTALFICRNHAFSI